MASSELAQFQGPRSTDWHPTQPHEHLTRQQFIDQVLPHARDAQKKWGIPVSVTLAQATVETGFGSSYPDNVTFGVKNYAPDGKSAMLWTTEEVKGQLVRERDHFRAYDSLGGAVDDYARMLRNNPGFKAAFDHPNDGYAFMKAVADAHYATDHNYARTVTEQIRAYDLTQYDDHSPRAAQQPAIPVLPRNQDVPADSAVTRTMNPPDPKSVALGGGGGASMMSTQNQPEAFNPMAGRVAAATMRNESVNATNMDAYIGWKASSDVGSTSVAAHQHAGAAGHHPQAAKAEEPHGWKAQARAGMAAAAARQQAAVHDASQPQVAVQTAAPRLR